MFIGSKDIPRISGAVPPNGPPKSLLLAATSEHQKCAR
jgi:hypothetical protein